MKSRIIVLIVLVMLLALAMAGARAIAPGRMSDGPIPVDLPGSETGGPIGGQPANPDGAGTDGGGVFCTMDAKICPDGSAVGRIPPNCDFAACPGPTVGSGTSDQVNIETRIDQGGSALGVKITPKAIIEDSRCPIGVMCIQAGTVRVDATVMSDQSGDTGQASSRRQTFVLNQPVRASGVEIELTDVQPVKRADVSLTQSDYRFIFTVRTAVPDMI